MPAESLLGPFDMDAAYPLTDERLYVGRLLRRRTDGQWLLFAFRNADEDGRFVGGVTEPMPVGWEGRSTCRAPRPARGDPVAVRHRRERRVRLSLNGFDVPAK